MISDKDRVGIMKVLSGTGTTDADGSFVFEQARRAMDDVVMDGA